MPIENTPEQIRAMRKPKRIQRKRTKGWKMPEGAVYVGRPTVWGNRWQIGVYSNKYGRALETAEEVVDCFRTFGWIEEHQRAYIRELLRGKDLACWCPLDKPCHADVLLEIANG